MYANVMAVVVVSDRPTQLRRRLSAGRDSAEPCLVGPRW